MNMKVFYVNPMSTGQSALYDRYLIDNISRDIDIFYFGDKNNEFIPQNCTFYPFFNYTIYNYNILKAFNYIRAWFRILGKANEERPDLIHIQWIKLRHFDMLMLRILKNRNIKVLFTAHNLLPHSDLREKTMPFFKRYYKNLDGVIVHSSSTKNELLSKFYITNEKIHVINHGAITLPVDEGKVANYIKMFKKEYNLDAKVVFLLIGAQSKYKGYDLLKDTWLGTPALCNNEHLCLILAGKVFDVDSEGYNNTNNVIKIEKFISDEEYVALTRLSSILLMPYLKISQSGVMMQAIHEHIPVLISNIGGLPDPLRIGTIGWNIGEPTIENLQSELLYLINHIDEITHVKNDLLSWQMVEEAYSWKGIGGKTSELYKESSLL